MVLETYYRKRSRKAVEANNEMDNLKKQEHNNNNNNSMDTAASDDPFVAKHDNITVPADDHEVVADTIIEVGSIYEIAHVHLPPRTPLHLRSIRVAMVSEKTEMNVAVRYPSEKSLGTYFSNSMNEIYPALDEKFVMGTILAAKVLHRQVPSQEFAEKKHLNGFWLVSSDDDDDEDVVLKKGSCLSQLKSNGMIRWGVRRQVKFLGRHCENMTNGDHNTNITQSSSSFVNGDHEVTKVENVEIQEENEDGEKDEEMDEDGEKHEEMEEDGDNGVKEEVEEEENEEEDEEDVNGDEDEVMEEIYESKENLKRKKYNFRDSVLKAKKVKREKQKQKRKKTPAKKHTNKCRQLMVYKSPKDRWSSERYKSAEKNLLEVMKAKGAVANKPILRPDLRAEARKRIGDTGLLDHLLKHVAGKLAPGGAERFRRRHNAEGQMEYWLENADLVNVRKDAGVSDPFWIPPPGWQPGDSPTQDPICAKELKLLKEEIFKVKRDAEEMVSKKQLELEEEVKRLRREIKELVSKKKEEEDKAIVVSSNPCGISQELNQLATALVSTKLDLDKAPVSLEKCKEKLIDISDFMKEMQEKIGKLMCKVDQRSKSNSALMVTTESCGEKEKKQERKEDEQQEGSENAADEDQHKKQQTSTAAATKRAEKASSASAEKKAAKIERLKSGFRICKPQGTFLWPNMARNNLNNNNNNNSNSNNMLSPHVVVQVEDLFVVPTPPSVSSSTASAPPMLPYHPHHHHPTSPVKPLAERRGVTVTVSTVSERPRFEEDRGDDHHHHHHQNKYSSSSTTTTTTTTTSSNKTTTTMINLNDAPFHHPSADDVFVAKPSSSRQTVTTTTVMPHLVASTMKEDMNAAPWKVAAGDHVTSKVGSSSTSEEQHSICCFSAPPCMSTQKGNWLALATLNSTSNESSSSHM